MARVRLMGRSFRGGQLDHPILRKIPIQNHESEDPKTIHAGFSRGTDQRLGSRASSRRKTVVVETGTSPTTQQRLARPPHVGDPPRCLADSTASARVGEARLDRCRKVKTAALLRRRFSRP